MPQRKIAVETNRPVEAGMIAMAGADEVFLIEQLFPHMRRGLREVPRDQLDHTVLQHWKPDAAVGVADIRNTPGASNWSGGTVERVQGDGSRNVFLDNISSPVGIAVDAAGSVFVSSYSGDTIVRVAPDGSRETIADGLATPTGIAFAHDGRLLIANRSSGETVALDMKSGGRTVVARGLSLPVGVVEISDGSIRFVPVWRARHPHPARWQGSGTRSKLRSSGRQNGWLGNLDSNQD
ncbi:hypothetical protein ACUSIJ_15080 [Pseudochelatococcus sp. B33]